MTTKEQLKAAIEALEKNEANYTNSGKPDAKVLTDILNTMISASFRDEVWDEMQGTDNLYKNITSKNVFCLAGRVSSGETIDLGDEDSDVYKGRLEKV